VRLHWDNPFIGSNSYDESVSPASTSPSDANGFSIVHTGGGGDDAQVRFVLLKAFCTANAESGEIACATINPLTTDRQRYAAIFERRSGGPWQARHGLSNAEYQATFDDLVGYGLRPTWVDGYSDGGQDRYAAIFEQRDGPPSVARHGLSNAEYQQAFDEFVGQGFQLICVSG
jgi:hypothetical protein